MKIPKTIKICISLIASNMLFGCAATFNKQEYISHVVNDYAINVSNVKNIYGIHYTVTSNTSYKGIWKTNGVLVTTDSALILYADNSANNKPELVLNLSYAEIKKIECVKARKKINQIQVYGDLGVLALQIISESGFVDLTNSYQLCNFIKEKEVPEVDVTKRILFPI